MSHGAAESVDLVIALCNQLFSCCVCDHILCVSCVFGVTVLFLCCRLGQVTLGKEVLNLTEFCTWLNKGY